MNTPGFVAEEAIREGSGHYVATFANHHPARTGLGVVPAGCAASAATTVLACGIAGSTAGTFVLADVACAIAAIATLEDCS
jgi:hypothetical protein